MRQFWFGEVTQLSGRGLSFTEPVSAILWASQGKQPICLEIAEQTDLLLTYYLFQGANCNSTSAYFYNETVFQNFFNGI